MRQPFFGRATIIHAILSLVISPATIAADETTPPAAATSGIEVVHVFARNLDFVQPQSSVGTKTDTPLLEVPASMSVIPMDRIDVQQADNLTEALRYTPGITSSDTDARTDFYRIRGFDQSGSGLFRDGLQLRSNGLAFFRFDTYGAERIDILRGPASVMYGQSGPGGLVNIKSKRPSAQPLRELEFEAGNFDRYQGKFDFAGNLGQSEVLQFRLTGLARDSGTQIEQIDDDRVFVAPAVTWTPNERTSLTVLANFQDDTNGSTQFLPASGTLLPNPNGHLPTSAFVGEEEFESYERQQYAVGYLFEHRYNDAITFRQNARYAALDADYEAVFGLGLQGDQRTLDRFSLIAKPKVDAFTIDSHVQATFTSGPLQHLMLGGVDYQRYESATRTGFDFSPAGAPPLDIFAPVFGAPVPRPPLFTRTDSDEDQIGVYLQDQIKFAERLVLTLGGRHDWVDTDIDDLNALTSQRQDSGSFTGRAGLTWLMSDLGVAPYVSYAESFLPVAGTDFFGAPFDPETGNQYEVGIKFEPPGRNLLFTAAAFDLARQNVLTADPVNPFAQIQTGEIESRGLEFEAVASAVRGLNLTAAYTLLDLEVTKSNNGDQGLKPNRVPKHSASIWADYTIQDGRFARLGMGSGLRYVGRSFADSLNTLEVPSYVLIDAVAHYDWHRLRLALNIKNLLGKTYVDNCLSAVSCVYGIERTVIGSVRYRF